MSEQLKKTGCFCPYCDEETARQAFHFCEPCQVVLRHCLTCKIVVEREATVCPQCGEPIE